MNIYQYRAPSDSNVCSYFKTFPLSVWSHKHFIENTNILDFEQSTRLWYENLTTIRNLPNSLVSKEILDIITKRKMGDTFTLNKKKRKYAEDEVHTSSVTTSAELLKDTFEHHKKYTQQKLDVSATPSPPSTVTFAINQDNEFSEEAVIVIEAKTSDEHIYSAVNESEITKQKPRNSFLPSSTSKPSGNEVSNPGISLSGLPSMTNNSTT
ncbi:4294_t:CDS:2, partial [Funneliformis mosseae]